MSFNPKVSPVLTARNKTPEELDALIKNKPRYGNIICQCEKISEGEIIEAIRKGHTTLDGIKFYTRAGMGRCQGGFCTYRILKIIARETGCSIEEITKRGADSNIIKKELSHV
jgi:glycerol-3-phosphate dehydrogenase